MRDSTESSRDGAGARLADAVATVGALPFCGWIPPWVDDEDFGRFGQVERYAAGFERDEEAFNVDVRHEVVDGGLALGRSHRSVEHDGCDPGAAETPFDKLQHGCELAEDDGFVGHVLGSQLVEIVDKGFDFGAGSPVLHLDSIDDRRFLYHLFILFNVGLLEIDTEGDVADRAVGIFW
jgi:hypothetical protein